MNDYEILTAALDDLIDHIESIDAVDPDLEGVLLKVRDQIEALRVTAEERI